MQPIRRSTAATVFGALLACGALSALAPAAEAQAPARRTTYRETGPRVRSAAMDNGRHVVVIDLDDNRLYFTRGRRVLWSAPVGTGTGMRLENGRGGWDFSTPRGAFHVVYKEREPDWIAPDWYFIENNLPVPGPNDQRRRFPRGLGAAAVFIGQGLAIHGTDKPELLGQRVSHGCIRLSNADALRLFHNVQVGTEVMIVGGQREPVATTPPRTTSRTSSRTGPPPRDPFVVELEGEDTYDLLQRLDDELVATAFAEGSPRWPSVASVLLFRGVKDGDDEALAGLLVKVGELGAGRLRDEYTTFLADAYAQGPLRTLEVLGGMERAERSRVARALVEATVALYPGDLTDVALQWPTKRAPRGVLRTTQRRAWDALQLAEQDFREEGGLALRDGR
jgi:lipoprotein-anchoring transpeptidase ErfK/SrfK